MIYQKETFNLALKFSSSTKTVSVKIRLVLLFFIHTNDFDFHYKSYYVGYYYVLQRQAYLRVWFKHCCVFRNVIEIVEIN